MPRRPVGSPRDFLFAKRSAVASCGERERPSRYMERLSGKEVGRKSRVNVRDTERERPPR